MARSEAPALGESRREQQPPPPTATAPVVDSTRKVSVPLVERHRPDAELPAQRGHRRVAVRHRGLGQPHLSFRQRELPPAPAPAGPCGLEAGHGAFADQLPLELGERGEDAEHESAGRGRGVDLRALAAEHPRVPPCRRWRDAVRLAQAVRAGQQFRRRQPAAGPPRAPPAPRCSGRPLPRDPSPSDHAVAPVPRRRGSGDPRPGRRQNIAKPLGPAKRSSGTRRPRSANRSGHSPIWGGR